MNAKLKDSGKCAQLSDNDFLASFNGAASFQKGIDYHGTEDKVEGVGFNGSRVWPRTPSSSLKAAPNKW